MAKKKEIVEEPTNTALLAPVDYGDMAGQGFDQQTSDDVSIPFLNIIQPLSPETAGGPDERIEGARPGSLLNSVTKEVFDGEAGVIFQPVDTKQEYIEWKPRNQGGGFVASHAIDSDVVIRARETAERYGKYGTVAGNDLVQSFYIVGLMHRSEDAAEQIVIGSPEPMVIAFTSTKIKPYRALMTKLSAFQRGRVPLYANRILITTTMEKRDKGISYNFRMAPLVDGDVAKSLIPAKMGGTAHPLLTEAQGLLKAYRSGLTKAASHTQGRGESGSSTDDADVPF